MAVANFPSIAPTSRSWTPGARPLSTYSSLSGYEVRVQHGNTAIGTALSLGFDNLTEAVGKQITDHYITAQGSFDTFALPAEIFAGMNSYAYVTPSGTTWRYARPPAVTYVAPGIQTVSVELIAIPV